jgi:hypothetical protein
MGKHYALLVISEPGADMKNILEPYNKYRPGEPIVITPREEFISRIRERFPMLAALGDNEIIEVLSESFEYIFDSEGNEVSIDNPNGKWEYWTVGGRFNKLLKLDETQAFVNSGLVKDLDFTFNKDEYAKGIRFWELCIENQEPKDAYEKFLIKVESDKPAIYYERIYGSKEIYAEARAHFSTWAVITADGTWHEFSGNPKDVIQWVKEYRARFIETADPNHIVTIVDYYA